MLPIFAKLASAARALQVKGATTKAKRAAARKGETAVKNEFNKSARRALFGKKGNAKSSFNAAANEKLGNEHGNTIADRANAKLNESIRARSPKVARVQDYVQAYRDNQRKQNARVRIEGQLRAEGKAQELTEDERKTAIEKTRLSANADRSSMFYALTKKFWEGVPYNERDQAIMQALGVRNLADAYDIVFKRVVGSVDSSELDEPFSIEKYDSELVEKYALTF